MTTTASHEVFIVLRNDPADGSVDVFADFNVAEEFGAVVDGHVVEEPILGRYDEYVQIVLQQRQEEP
jgi:hypothetical protein